MQMRLDVSHQEFRKSSTNKIRRQLHPLRCHYLAEEISNANNQHRLGAIELPTMSVEVTLTVTQH